MEKIMMMLENEKSKFVAGGLNIKLNKDSTYNYLECLVKNNLEKNISDSELVHEFNVYLILINSELRMLLTNKTDLKLEILDNLEKKIELFNLSLDKLFKESGHKTFAIYNTNSFSL